MGSRKITSLSDFFLPNHTDNQTLCYLTTLVPFSFRHERRYIRKIWQEIKVGDIVHLSCNEVIPADLILLWSSDKQGVCYIDTSNIDGENNLKQRQVVQGVNQQVGQQASSGIDCQVLNKTNCTGELI